jgi:hypothetical protein
MTVSEERLAVVRQLMTQANYDALVVPRADEYLGEVYWVCRYGAGTA